jgi:peptidoglycan LD-endopeptidase LytH
MLYMRRTLFLSGIILFSMVFVTPYLMAFLDYTGKLVHRVTFPVKMALMCFKEPDRHISIPIASVQVKQVRDTWHEARPGDRRHEGQDIFAPRGTPVHSATAGYVMRVGENTLGGKTVSVLGAGGRVYYYAHLDAYAPGIEVGQAVKPETIIGYVGTTGNARRTPPHLHFGVYTFMGTINPLPLLTNR